MSSRFVGRRILGIIAMVVSAMVIFYWSHRYFRYLDYNPSLSNEIPAVELPKNLASFFNEAICPPGWEEVEAAQGRMILSTQIKALIGKTAGEPLTDQEDRQHRHHFMLTTTLPSTGLSAQACCQWDGGEAGFYRSDVHGSQGTSQLPFYQSPFCQWTGEFAEETEEAEVLQQEGGSDSKNTEPSPVSNSSTAGNTPDKEGVPSLDETQGLVTHITSRILPKGSIHFFNDSVCPEGWQVHQPSLQRFILPLPPKGEPGLAVGKAFPVTKKTLPKPPPHSHEVNINVKTQDIGFVTIKGDRQLAKHGEYTFDVEQKDVESNLPYIGLLACESKTRQRMMLPRGMTIFLEQNECPSGWTQVDESQGRYLVARPAEHMGNAAFGGESMIDGEIRAHQHDFRGNLHLKPRSAKVSTGCCLQGFAAGTTYSFKGTTEAKVIPYPYIQLLQCGLK